MKYLKYFENYNIQMDNKVRNRFKDNKINNFDDNFLEIDIKLTDSEIKKIRLEFPNYYVLYSNRMNKLWLKNKPKQINLKEFVEGDFVYHNSKKEYRNSILTNGLRPSSNLDTPLGYENLIFVYDKELFEGDDAYIPEENYDVWQIDIKNSDIKWLETPNIHFDEGEGVYCTDSIIAPNYIKLIEN
jgi:hypothetical protein